MRYNVMFNAADISVKCFSGCAGRAGFKPMLLSFIVGVLGLSFAPESFAQDAAAAQDSSVPSLEQTLPAGLLSAASAEAPESSPSVPMIPPDQDTGAPSLSDLLGTAEKGVQEYKPVDPEAAMGLTPPSGPVKKEDAAAAEHKEAFSGAVDSMMPLKPSEIRRMLEVYDGTTQAAETPIYPNPEPESSFVQASLEPGAKPVVVKAAVGNVTTISMVDATGQPWPIQDLTWAGDFQVEQPDSGSNMIRISPNAHFAQGNVSMRLVGLNPPVILTLATERKTVHVRLDVQIPEVGPKGVLPPVLTPVSIKAGDDEITKVLLGISSQAGLSKMTVEGVDGRTSAYRKEGGQLYVRTPYTLLSPAWDKSVQSADGLHVYSLTDTPVLLLSDKGKMLRAYLSPMEQSNDQ